MRKFDVTERDRDEFTFSVGFAPIETVNANFSYRGRKDDFASDTLSSISTWDSAAGTFVTVPIDPTQLGLLKDESSSLVLDLNYSPSQRMSLSGFYSRESLDSKQRGRYLDENNRVNDIASGKDWQDTSGDFLWNADFADETDALGIGTSFVIGDDFDVGVDFTHYRGTVDIDYRAGAEIAEDDTTSFHDWAEWSSPEQVEFRTNTVELNATRHVSENLEVGFTYLYQQYKEKDWQQAASSAHQDALSENFVADHDPETAGTSQDRPGSRLVRLTDLLAPDYRVNVFYITLEYSW